LAIGPIAKLFGAQNLFKFKFRISDIVILKSSIKSNSSIKYTKQQHSNKDYKSVFHTEILLQISAKQDTGLQRSEDLEQLRLLELGYEIKVAVVEDEAIGVDTPQELKKLERMLLCQSNIFSLQAESFPH